MGAFSPGRLQVAGGVRPVPDSLCTGNDFLLSVTSGGGLPERTYYFLVDCLAEPRRRDWTRRCY